MLPRADFLQLCLVCWTHGGWADFFRQCSSGEGVPGDRSLLMVSDPGASCFVLTVITFPCRTWWPYQFVLNLILVVSPVH